MLNNEIQNILDERRIKLVFDSNRRIVTDFLNDRSSQRVFNFLTTNGSWRVLFNAVVKSDWLDSSSIRKAFSELSKESKCSIVYEATCRCGAHSDTPIITRKISKAMFKKTITCKKCGEIKLDFSKYKPVSDVSEDSILKILRIGKERGFLDYNVSAYCFVCQETLPFSPSGEKIKCPKCGELRKITVGFFPSSLKLQSLVKNQQGYWLEWYVYELLRKRFPTEYGLIYKENGSATNIDILCLKNNELWVIECKDTSDVADFIKNISTLKKMGDKVCLISTNNIDKKDLDTIKQLLKDKFVHVHPEDAEKIPEIIANSAPNVRCLLPK
jgi:ssDNA-binding Zn-finger/Zn-ribbon topoisomerase 1